MDQSTITITFCDQAENHVGMQKIGNPANNGFDLNDFFKIKKWFENKNGECELLDLNYPLEDNNIYPNDEAYILIIRNGIDILLDPDNSDNLMDELKNLDWDKKALMYGHVVNKKARHNLCFAENKQKPNYKSGKGRVISFKDVPLLEKVKNDISDIIGIEDLVAEGNYYYDAKKCGVGFHGDGERVLVIGVRLGATIPLVYQWYYNSKPIGQKIKLNLNNGDIYFMSEKATGNDWKKKTIYTLRHAAGAKKYIQ